MLPMIRHLGLVVLLSSCSDSSESAMRCGDGVVSANVESIESCDDGELNGTATSTCRIDCTSAESRWLARDDESTTLPFPAKKLVATERALVISNYDDRGIAVVPQRNLGVPILLRGAAPARSFTVTGSSEIDGTIVMWIEQGTSQADLPALYWANLSESPPQPREIPYPLVDTSGGIFIQNENYTWDGFADVGKDRRLYQVQFSSLQPPAPQIWELGTAPDGDLVAAMVVVAGDMRGIAYFFDDGFSTRVAIATHPGDGIPSIVRTVRLPARVVDIARAHLNRDGGLDVVTILTPDGVIYAWDFSDPDPEAFLRVFGRVRPGSQHLFGWTSMVAVTREGEVAHLVENTKGESLATQYHRVGVQCSVCTIAETAGPTAEWFAFDTIAIRGWPEPYEPPRQTP